MEESDELLAIIKEMQQSINKISGEVEEIKKEISDMKTNKEVNKNLKQTEGENSEEVKSQEEITNQKLDDLCSEVKTISDDIVLIKKDLYPLKQGTAVLINSAEEIKNEVNNTKILGANIDNKLGYIYNTVCENSAKSQKSIGDIIKDYKNSLDGITDVQEEMVSDLKALKTHFSIEDNYDYKINAKVIRVK